MVAVLVAIATASTALLGPVTPVANRAPTVRMAVDTADGGSTRRDLLATAALTMIGGGLANAAPQSASASYALYQSSYDSFQDRKATGYVPVATSDTASLSELQDNIRRKRPMSTNKPEKAPQYAAACARTAVPRLLAFSDHFCLQRF